jgi:hypothetical protein
MYVIIKIFVDEISLSTLSQVISSSAKKIPFLSELFRFLTTDNYHCVVLQSNYVIPYCRYTFSFHLWFGKG